MCGIAGILHLDKEKLVDKKLLKKITDIIIHRGPDGEGLFINNNVGLGHRRLSIIDLTDTGHQPMSYNNGNLWITHNGEIYNYVELKEELVKKGYHFISTSDTEVVLAAYLEWGESCVERFNGMWAFAIWDKNNDKLFISRDRFGIKPLYYTFIDNTVIFCSEIKGILAYSDSLFKINEDQIYNYALYGEVRMGLKNEETVFKNIKQLFAGHNLIFCKGKVRNYPYWNVHPRENKLSFEETVSEFKRLFYQSLKYRMRSDVEVGSCLSGGLDSSSIVSFSTKSFGKNFHSFSAIWPAEPCDEFYYMQKVNEKWNCLPHYIQPDLDNLLDIIDQEIYYQEIPLPGSSLIAQWFVMQKAKEAGVKVLLDGQGADEVLSGYPRYIIPYLNELIFHFKWIELYSNYKDLKSNGYPIKRILGMQKNKIFAKNNTVLPVKNEYFKKQAKINRKYYNYNFLPDYLTDEIQDSCLPGLLHYEDRNSMAHSVEARVPFLDYQLAEFCLNIPTEYKIKGTLTKVILREAMKHVLPVEVYNRRDKIGFSTPIEKAFFNQNNDHYSYIVDVIYKSRIKELGIIDMDNIGEFISGNEFRLYTLARFIDQWF